MEKRLITQLIGGTVCISVSSLVPELPKGVGKGVLVITGDLAGIAGIAGQFDGE